MRQRLPAAVVALGVTSFFTDVGGEMIFPLLPVFVASLGATPTFLGLVEGVADAVASFLKLASGYVADHTPRKKPIVVFGYGLAAMARPLVALASAPWHVLLVRVSDRVGKGLRSAPRDVLIANSVASHETGRAFGFHRAMDHAGAVVGPVIATVLLSLGWELREVFWVAIVPGVLAVVAVSSVREVPVEPPPAEVSAVASSAPLPRPLRSFLAILLVFSIGNSSDAFLLLRAKDLGVPIASIPMLWALFHVAKVVSAYVGGDWSDRVDRSKLIVGGWLIYAGTYLAFGLATESWHAWALFFIYGSYFGLTEPAEKALVKDLSPAQVRGRAYGYYNFVLGISAVPAGLLTGWLWQTWSPFAALATGAGIATASSIALTLWSRGRPVAA